MTIVNVAAAAAAMVLFFEEVQSRSDVAAIIKTNLEGNWGDWVGMTYCPERTWAYQFRQRVDDYEGATEDDTSLNAVSLRCMDMNGNFVADILPHSGYFGAWASSGVCQRAPWASLLTGFRIKVEDDQGPFRDDTSANDVELCCYGAGTTVKAPNGERFGDWSKWAYCPAETAVCGIDVRMEGRSGDDTAMNGMRLACCPIIRRNGEDCTDNTQCDSGSCKGGKCCYSYDNRCGECLGVADNGGCKYCALAGDHYDGATKTCHADHPGGGPCAGNGDCLSGLCGAGICCSSNVPGCTSCDQASGRCLACSSDYYLQNGYCLPRVPVGGVCTPGVQKQCTTDICGVDHCCLSSANHCLGCGTDGKCVSCDESKGYHLKPDGTCGLGKNPGEVCAANTECASKACTGSICCQYSLPHCTKCGPNGLCAKCEIGYYVSSSGSCLPVARDYIVVKKALAWKDAEKYCYTKYKTHLATILTSEDVQKISTLKLATTRNYWMGLQDRVNEGAYKFSSGFDLGVTNWIPGQPTGPLQPSEDCVQLVGRSAFQWNDFACSAKNYFVCDRF